MDCRLHQRMTSLERGRFKQFYIFENYIFNPLFVENFKPIGILLILMIFYRHPSKIWGLNKAHETPTLEIKNYRFQFSLTWARPSVDSICSYWRWCVLCLCFLVDPHLRGLDDVKYTYLHNPLDLREHVLPP